MKYKVGDRLEIQWLDIEARNSWTDIEQACQYCPKIYYNMGYYLNEDKEFFRIYDSIDGDKKVIGYTVFPKGCVVKVIKLKEK